MLGLVEMAVEATAVATGGWAGEDCSSTSDWRGVAVTLSGWTGGTAMVATMLDEAKETGRLVRLGMGAICGVS